jgi:hypothetical protein
MIVRVLDDRIQLITQPDHAHLARTIMERCAGLAARPRRDAILLATAEHDNGWDVENAAPTVDPTTGAVVDFVSASFRVRQTVWPRAVARLAGDPWAAALVAHHALIVYKRFRPDAAWGSFFAEMEVARDTMLRARGLPLGVLVDDYPFVRLGDLISLAFCTGHTDAQRFDEWTIQLSGTRVAVAPAPVWRGGDSHCHHGERDWQSTPSIRRGAAWCIARRDLDDTTGSGRRSAPLNRPA